MDSLKDKIKRFLEIGSGDGYGSGSGDGSGDGYGDGDGYGYGYGDGYGYGSGYGSGSGYGDGSGSGDGYGDGDGDGSGYGSGDGSGYGDGDGDGDGSGDGYGITEINSHKLYNIDLTPTAIISVHGSYAKGFTVKQNSILVPCYVAREGNFFAHGETLHEAAEAAHAKAMENKPLDERIADTVKKHTDPTEIISNTELFALHHILTGSCEFGRRQFCQNHGISLEGAMTMCDFIDITQNDYGRDAILQLANSYGYKPKKQ